MIIIDTGPLVALFDKSDHYHRLCKETLAQIREPLITSGPVITEVMYLLNFSSVAQELCLDFIESGGANIHPGDSREFHRIHLLMKRYADLPVDFADASLVAIAEAKKIATIFTIDHKDFRIYVPNHVKNFILLPEKGV